MNRDITELDPTRDHDERFDPDGPQGRAVLAAAIARGEDAPAPPPRRRRRLSAALVGTAAAGVAAVVLVGGGGSSPVAPQVAVAQALERTADFTSGVIRTSGETTMPKSGYVVSGEQVTRFSGDDLSAESVTRERLPDGTPKSTEHAYRVVDGKAYLRDDDGTWKEVPAARDAARDLVRQTRAEVDNRPLAEVVRAAPDVREEDGEYVATLTPEQQEQVPALPFGVVKVGDEPVTFRVRLAADGTIRTVTIAVEGAKRTASYEELGEPQEIVAPPVG